MTFQVKHIFVVPPTIFYRWPNQSVFLWKLDFTLSWSWASTLKAQLLKKKPKVKNQKVFPNLFILIDCSYSGYFSDCRIANLTFCLETCRLTLGCGDLFVTIKNGTEQKFLVFIIMKTFSGGPLGVSQISRIYPTKKLLKINRRIIFIEKKIKVFLKQPIFIKFFSPQI